MKDYSLAKSIGVEIYELIEEFYNKNLNDEKVVKELDEKLYYIKEKLAERKKTTKKNIETILSQFRFSERQLIKDVEAYYTAYSNILNTLFKDRKETKSMLYIPDLPLEMLFHYFKNPNNDIMLIISRIKTNRSFLNKIIKREIFGIQEQFNECATKFYKFGVAIVCDKNEKEKIVSVCKRVWPALGRRIFSYSEFNIDTMRKNYQGIIQPLILKTRDFAIEAQKEEIRFFLEPYDNLQELIENYVNEKQKAKIYEELSIRDLGGIAFILKHDMENPEFKKTYENIIKKIQINSKKTNFVKIENCIEKKEKSGYRAIHFIFDQGLPEKIELRFCDFRQWGENEFGQAYAARYKSSLEKIHIKKEFLPILKKIYEYFGEKLS